MGPKTIDELSHKESIAHYNAVMIEELRSQFKFVIEKSESSEGRLRQLIEDLRKENQEDHDDIKLVLRKNSDMFEQVDRRFDILEKKVDGLEQKVESHDRRFESLEHKFDRLEQKVDGHDLRFDTLEQKMDEVIGAVQRH